MKEMEEEAEKLKEMQGEVEKQMMSAKSREFGGNAITGYLMLSLKLWALFQRESRTEPIKMGRGIA